MAPDLVNRLRCRIYSGFKRITNGFSPLFYKSDKRSRKAYYNILALLAIKAVNVGIGIILVPLSLNYLDPTRYGIWVTISTVFTWFGLFDVGMGHGLRNRLTEALAKRELEKARVYVSTTYAALLVVFACIFLLFLIANVFIDWTAVLNTPQEYQSELSVIAGCVFFFVCMRFVTQLIGSIAFANQEPALSQLIDLGGRIVALIGIYLLTLCSERSMLYLGLSLTALPALTSIPLSIIIFRGRYKAMRPSPSLVRFQELRPILSLGVRFFIIQMAAVIFYQTNTIVISQLFGPAEVTPYSIAFQYFNVATFAFLTILTPYWSAFTDAYARGELEWIRRVMRNLRLAWLGLLVFVAALYLLSKPLICLWVGDKVAVQRDLYLVIAIYVLVDACSNIYSHFMNGVGKVMTQLYIATGIALFHIPLAIYFCRHFGITGIMYSTIFFGCVVIFVYDMQYKKILSRTASGIWNR